MASGLSLVPYQGNSLAQTGGASQAASKDAASLLDNAMADSLGKASQAQASKIALDTENSILDGQMDSASKSLNSGQKAAKAIQF
ncbi:hypothetical protein ACFFL1_17050 [Samsonia erythrinae]|uniref:Hrp pili protein HrpA n=1 Tax=Samsonia erythrinae TaxID=160434 RepID=A0A4R3VQM8_9GAMM|nr:hypothetical protein [Samsonia erythrinae]TCV05760.1 hypothetical protein EDC54_10526 [Samsonia erythrinae]